MYQGRFESKTVAARNMSRLQQQENAPTSQQCAPIPQLNEHDEELQQLLVEQTPVAPVEQPEEQFAPVQPVAEYTEEQLIPTQPIPTQAEEPEFLLPLQPAPADPEEALPLSKKAPALMPATALSRSMTSVMRLPGMDIS